MWAEETVAPIRALQRSIALTSRHALYPCRAPCNSPIPNPRSPNPRFPNPTTMA